MPVQDNETKVAVPIQATLYYHLLPLQRVKAALHGFVVPSSDL
jgi:hypothetical protein